MITQSRRDYARAVARAVAKNIADGWHSGHEKESDAKLDSIIDAYAIVCAPDGYSEDDVVAAADECYDALLRWRREKWEASNEVDQKMG